MSNCINKIIFRTKLFETGYVANHKWRQAPVLACCITFINTHPIVIIAT